MPLEIRKQRNGAIRRIWYGRYTVNGKRYALNLGVNVEGTPHESLSLKEMGDADFERSRMKARLKLEQIIEEAHRNDNPIRLAEHIYEMKTGERLQSVTLGELPKAWENIPRHNPPCKRYAEQCLSRLKKFTEFVQRNYSQIRTLDQVTRKVAEAFMDHEDARGVSSKTWNDTLKLMRATCKYVLPAGCSNPFGRIMARATGTVYRQPFSQDELAEVLKAAQHDDFIRPIIITGMCTAMRRGDCCLLQWSAVDLQECFLSVKTSKTGVMVSIPIFPLLYNELVLRKQEGDDVFPEQARMFRENPDGISWRVQKVLKRAEIETVAERKNGLHKASVKGFHSLRTTWITMALTAGVPMELVRRVTGHSTVDVVLKHYFRPGREAFRTALETAMPKMLTGGAGERPDPVKAVQELAQVAPELKSEELVKKIKELAAALAA